MSEETTEEVWEDENFLDEVIQLELALTNTNNMSNSPQQPPLISCYSPPRELSQRTAVADHTNSYGRSSDGIVAKCASSSTDSDKDFEIKRLKIDLGRVSKQLAELEHECFELKKERNEKEELIKFASSKNDKKDADVHHLKGTNLYCGVPAAEHHGVSGQFQNAKGSDDQVAPPINIASSSCKAIGVQVDLPSHLDLNKKLLCIWGFTSDQQLGKNLISKLFLDCSLEFYVLFGCMSIDTSSKILDSPEVGSPDVTLQYHVHSCTSSEAAKVSHLCSVLTKICNGMIQLEALLEPLLDLCRVENVVIVIRSLRILHVFLKHLLTLERKAEKRNNVTVERVLSGNGIGDFHGTNSARSKLFPLGRDDASCAGYVLYARRFSDAETPCKKGCQSPGRAASLFSINWVSLFELIYQIAMSNTEEYLRSEAVSIMNMIVMRGHSYMDREKLCQTLVFESISQLLKKEAGLHVQKEAVHLLYLLLNCPNIFVTFCSGCKGENASATNEKKKDPLAPNGFSMILEGLADCIVSSGNGVQDLELRRNAIVVLAFLASSGKSGFEILVNHKLSREANFLMVILQVLVSEINIEAATCTVPADLFSARTLLIREALILLNRLVSNPTYSPIVFEVLTNSRDMVSLTIDVANRLSRKDQIWGKYNSISRQMRYSEVVDLGRVLKKRVFTYLADNNIS